jgi:DNA-binding beta-propeller fold protein YncE
MARKLIPGSLLRASILSCSLLLVSAAGAFPAGSEYKVVRRMPVGGDGPWDGLKVDPNGQRIYITRGSHVMVVDETSGKVVGDILIANAKNVHEIALAPDLGKGFTSNGSAGTVTVFDLKTLKPSFDVKVTGQDPDGIIYDPITKRVFVFNAKTNNATVFDADTGKIVGTVKLSGAPEQAQLDGKGNVFVNIDDKSTMIKFDAKSLTIKAEWPLAPCDGPSALTYDAAHNRLFAACDKVMAVVNPDTGKVVASPPIGGDPDGNAYDPATGMLFASCKEGLVSLIHQDSPDKYRVVTNVTTQYGTSTMTIDPKTHHVFTISADYSTPAKTPDNPKPRPRQIPGSFVVLDIASQ